MSAEHTFPCLGPQESASPHWVEEWTFLTSKMVVHRPLSKILSLYIWQSTFFGPDIFLSLEHFHMSEWLTFAYLIKPNIRSTPTFVSKWGLSCSQYILELINSPALGIERTCQKTPMEHFRLFSGAKNNNFYLTGDKNQPSFLLLFLHTHSTHHHKCKKYVGMPSSYSVSKYRL